MNEPTYSLETYARSESKGVLFGKEVHDLIDGAKQLGPIINVEGGESQVRVNGLLVYRTTPLVFHDGDNPCAGEQRQALLGGTIIITEKDQPDGEVTYILDIYNQIITSLDAPPPPGIIYRIVTTGNPDRLPDPTVLTINPTPGKKHLLGFFNKKPSGNSGEFQGKDIIMHECPDLTRHEIAHIVAPQANAARLFIQAVDLVSHKNK
jgi:hypothetical protein